MRFFLFEEDTLSFLPASCVMMMMMMMLSMRNDGKKKCTSDSLYKKKTNLP